MGLKNTVLPDGQPPTVAVTVLVQLCGLKANETELAAVLFTKMAKQGILTLTLYIILE